MAVPARKPVTRRISVKALVQALSGTEQAYPVYQFSNRSFYDKRKHNPSNGL